LRKRLDALGYPSLKKFHAASAELGLSYETLRQVVYLGRTPRSETLLRLLKGMRFTPPQVRKIMELAYQGLYEADQKDLFAGGPPRVEEPEAAPAPRAPAPATGSRPGDPAASAGEPDLEDPEDIAARLARTLPRIPMKGHEDFWDTVRYVTLAAERKARELGRRRAEQPLLFEAEPEAVYHFLARTGRIVPFMARGEALVLARCDGIDYRDRFRGALVGAAAGYLLGRPAQGLSARDVEELYGRIGPEHAARAAAACGEPPAFLLLARLLAARGRLDPAEAAAAYAAAPAAAGSGGPEFARNVIERGYPWYEAGSAAPESAPAVRVVPIALARAADGRRLRLEAGIDAAVTHHGTAAVAAAILQAAAVAHLLHTPPGCLDPLAFGRTLAPLVAGMEPERPPSRIRGSRPAPLLWRRVGTEVPALLLRRAEPREMAEILGNGPAAAEGLPLAWACFLASPDDFGGAVLPAVNLGHDAQAIGALAGALAGAYLGASAIPAAILEALPWRADLEDAADALCAMASPQRP